MEEKFARYKNMLKAIEAERKNEEQYYKNLAAKRSVSQRLDSGLLWWGVKINSRRYGIGDVVEVQVERTRMTGEPHKLKVGAGVRLFKEGRDKDYQGVLSYIRKDRAVVSVLDERLMHDNDIQYGNVGLELVYDERPYKVMRNSIDSLMKSKEEHIMSIRDGLDKEDAFQEEWHHSVNLQALPDYLNEAQRDAISKISSCGQIGIIHGPPGTGKTTTLVALIEQLAKTEKKILVCAPSNNAVDLLAKLLDEKNVPVLRIGNISRIGDELVHLSLSEKARNHNDWKHIKKVRIDANEASKMAEQHKRKFGEQQRNERRQMRLEAKELRKWARELEDRLTNLLIDEARVICTTLIGAQSRVIEHLKYSTLVIDEASQALEPESWVAMQLARRTILAGDHLQLAPVVKSDEAKKYELDKTLLDRLTGKIHFDFLLDTQYRMHEKILQFSNARFYKNLLKSHHTVKDRLLPEDQKSVVMIDTSGCGFEEEFDTKKRSYKNSQEFLILREYLLTQREKQLPYNIGIISPYASQVQYIRDSVKEDEVFEGMNIEVDTVDGFQGQEKDIIYISLVRSNDRAAIGFLSDERRLNVAMTRAKMKLVMVGDLSTLSTNSLFRDLSEFIETEDFYKSAWEYMAY